MNVDAAPGEFRSQPLREDLHVAGENNQVGVRAADQLPDGSFLLELGRFCHRQVVKRYAVKVDSGVRLQRVVRDDGRDIHHQLADAPSVQQIGQAVILL